MAYRDGISPARCVAIRFMPAPVSAANMITAARPGTTHSTAFAAGDAYASRQPDPVLQQAEQEHDLTLSNQ